MDVHTFLALAVAATTAVSAYLLFNDVSIGRSDSKSRRQTRRP